MLVIQKITLVWHKEERGGKFAEARSRFNFALPINRTPGKTDECLLDEHRLYQHVNKFYTLQEYDKLLGFEWSARVRREYSPPVRLSELKVKNVTFTEVDSGIRVNFSYDPQLNGAPPRRGHNKDFNDTNSPFFGEDILNETAFALALGQMGRIAYNGRFSDCDNGHWWYEQTVVNIANVENFKSNVFVGREFDFVYERLAELR